MNDELRNESQVVDNTSMQPSVNPAPVVDVTPTVSVDSNVNVSPVIDIESAAGFDDVDDSVDEVVEPYEKIETFKIDDNMPEELKAQLEKFNRQTENLNNIMTTPITTDDFDTSDDDDDTEALEEDEEEIEEDDEEIEEDDDTEELGDLF